MSLISELPVLVIVIILQQLASEEFEDFLNFFKILAQSQNREAISRIMSCYPVQDLYRWGHHSNIAKRNMLYWFMMTVASPSINNYDALFYIHFRIIMQKNSGCFHLFNNSYEVIQLLANGNHILSDFTVKILDIYYHPWRREEAVNKLALMATHTKTMRQIPIFIQSLHMIAKSVWPNEVFEELFGPPICLQSKSDSKRHYQPDGLPIQPSCMYNYACEQCKVAIIVACLADYNSFPCMY